MLDFKQGGSLEVVAEAGRFLDSMYTLSVPSFEFGFTSWLKREVLKRSGGRIQVVQGLI
jgi:hypothetical protein